MASCFYTKDWSWVHSTDPAQKKKHWRSPQSSTNISCRDWKLLHAIRSRKSDRIRSYKILCKTEKIKKHLPIIISPEKELSTFHNSAAFIYSGVLSGPFTGLALTGISLHNRNFPKRNKRIKQPVYFFCLHLFHIYQFQIGFVSSVIQNYLHFLLKDGGDFGRITSVIDLDFLPSLRL